MAILTTLGVIVIAAVLAGIVILLTRSRAAAHGPRCGKCGYDLTGSESNRCPECGKLFIEAGVLVPPGPEAVRRLRTTMIRTSAVFIAVFVLVVTMVILAGYAAIQAQRAAMAQAQAAAAQAKAAAVNAFLQQTLAATSQPAVATSQASEK